MRSTQKPARSAFAVSVCAFRVIALQADLSTLRPMKSVKPLFVGQTRPVVVGAESGVVVARESRQHVRRQVSCQASIATLEAERDLSTGAPYFLVTAGSTLDVGDGGVGLRVETSISEGRRVLLDLTTDDGENLARAARVAWTSRDAHGVEFLGLCFDEPWPGFSEQF